MDNIKAFNRWGTEGITVTDPGLRDYITLVPKIAPKTGARYANKRFYKSRIFIVERLINKLMNPGHKGKKHYRTSSTCTGKAITTERIVEGAFEIIEQRTKQNPIKVCVQAIENAAPREEIISIEYGGARYPKAVECSPQRRVDVALRSITQGTYLKSFNHKKGAAEALAEEIMLASNRSAASHAIIKKQELERQADASR